MCERTESPTQLRRTRSADAAQASRLRRELDAWLHQSALSLTESRCADVLLGVNEALANCAEHAYHGRGDGDISMHATYDDAAQRVHVKISDHGRWRPRAAVVCSHRGRGLALMRALADQCTVDRGAAGTTVRLDYDVSS
ncbi:ATP-binding protein [Mycobacterium hodleri]|uniref:ATP-binding protein n=1 Tax=Mycolicibacterium hodleri TaxID=49897 RepID=UPI0021F25A96|nr:ATP-binding protein [Mycolicibacterium hodleri]MCV7137121.1 ATP-binding protein [Mycolicibacterium hodleri]